MDKLFEQLARGDMPNVIELMSAISELSDLYPGCEDCQVKVTSKRKPVEKPDKIKRTSNAK